MVAPVGQWHDSLSGDADARGGGAAPMRRFQGIRPEISQPPLRESVLAIHLGGAKRVIRLRGRNREEFDREPRELQLLDVIGARNATITTCLLALLDDAARPAPGRLYRGGLLMAISFNLVRHYSTLSPTLATEALGARPGRPARGGLAGWQIRRVIDYMQANIDTEISIYGALIGLTGLSRAQSFRAFRQSTGRSPHAFLSDLRLDQARRLLQATDLPVGSVARAVGLQRGQLAETFRKRFDLSPTGLRRMRRRSP